MEPRALPVYRGALARRYYEMLRIDALDVAAGIRLDTNLITGRDEERHLHDQPRLDSRGLGAASGGVALEARLGIGDFEIHRGRQVNAEWLIVVGDDLDLHAIEQVVFGVAKLLAC